MTIENKGAHAMKKRKNKKENESDRRRWKKEKRPKEKGTVPSEAQVSSIENDRHEDALQCTAVRRVAYTLPYR